jgi:ABC-2 type transport system ATP-binding protein
MTHAVEAESLVKTYGGVRAVDGIDLQVPEGTVVGLLGPNGAGKTTIVRILTTLLRPDSGRASVAGVDVIHHPNRVRRMIGLAGQYAAVDQYLTGRENLVMVGRLHHLSRKQARARAEELLERFNLIEAGERITSGYSGGMRRRLDLAASLVVGPRVLFLDEPTTGLDPRSRIGMWDVIAELVAEGTTLLLTTQYLEEADRLAHSVAIIDQGRVIARDTTDALKKQFSREQLNIVVHTPAMIAPTVTVLAALAGSDPVVDTMSRRITVPITSGARLLTEAIRRLDAVGVVIDDLVLRRPTLDDVFLALTGDVCGQESTP